MPRQWALHGGDDVLRRPANMPEWLNHVMKELTRPPYFLEHLYKERQNQRPNAPSSDESPVIPVEKRDSDRKEKKFDSSRKDAYVKPDSAVQRPRFEGKSSGPQQSHRERTPANQPEFVETALSATDKTTSGHTGWQSVLRTANLPISLPKAYGWTVKRCTPVTNVVKVDTKSGLFALKHTHLSPRRVEFLHLVMSYLKDQGYTLYAPFAVTKDGKKPYVVRKQQTYYATKWVPGNPANFASVQQISLVAQTLAQYHELTRGFEPETYSPPMEFNLSSMYRRRTEDLKALLVRAEAQSPADDFDRQLLNLSSQLRSDAEACLRELEDPKIAEFLAKDEEFPGLCHLDVIPGNFVFNEQQKMVAIDYDLSTYAPRTLDMSHLLRRSLQKLNWRSEGAYNCFVQYNQVRSIQREEYQIVHALLRFPYRIWRLAHTRYRVLKDDTQFEEMADAAAQETRRQNFLSEYERQINGLDAP